MSPEEKERIEKAKIPPSTFTPRVQLPDYKENYSRTIVWGGLSTFTPEVQLPDYKENYSRAIVWSGLSTFTPEVQLPDYKENYSRAIVWSGLNMLCRRDAVREGDGEAMMSHWKMDLVHLFAKKTPKIPSLST